MSQPVRSVADVVTAHRQLEGGGFPVRRPFPTVGMEMVDPFLLLDEMGPVEWDPGAAIGAPDHPHRGFETVTYVLAGKVHHEDSGRHSAVTGPGDVQWMTAGAGVVHSELPEEGFKEQGGLMHGFQIWVNLPRRDKMMEPRYQDVPSGKLPTAESDDGRVWVKVIAGEAMGESAVVDTRIPIVLQHYRLRPGGVHVQPIASGHACFAYVFRGEGSFGEEARPGREGQMVVFDREGDAVRLAGPASGDDPVELLLLAGEPIEEPVARYGPFVMNSPAEIREAIADFQSGRMGRIGR